MCAEQEDAPSDPLVQQANGAFREGSRQTKGGFEKKVENSFSVSYLVQGVLRPDLIKRSDQWVSKRHPNGSEEV